MKASYHNYQHWRDVMVHEAGLQLTSEYCKERIAALGNDKDPSTRAFLDTYGAQHRDQVVKWFQQAMAEA